MFGAETRAAKKARKMDRIRNEKIRRTKKVGEISKKVQERRLVQVSHGKG